MSDPAQAAPANPPVAETQSSIHQPATAPAPIADEPAWLPARLQREREAGKKDILKDLGVEDPKEVKAALKALKDKQESEKSELQRATEKAAAAEGAAKEAARYAQALQAHATALLSGLPEEHRATVLDIAGDDPARQLEVHAKLIARGAIKPPVAAPANTAPAAPPPSGTAPPQESKKAIWQRMKASGDHLGASIYLSTNMLEIFPPK